MPRPENALFDTLGFTWDRSLLPVIIPAQSVELVCFKVHKSLSQFVWEASLLEGLALKFSEIQTLLDGVSVSGHSIATQAQVLRLASCTKRLIAMVRSGHFGLTRPVFCEINSLLVRQPSQGNSVFRDEQYELNSKSSSADELRAAALASPRLSGAPVLNSIFNEGTTSLQVCSPFERAVAFFLFSSVQSFFVEANQPTSRFMMNGVLLSHGIDAISIPLADVQHFEEIIERFRETRDGSAMMGYLAGLCAPGTSFDKVR